MANSSPIDGRDPAALVWVIVNGSLHLEFIGLTLIVRVVHAEGKNQTFPQLNSLPSQILQGP